MRWKQTSKKTGDEGEKKGIVCILRAVMLRYNYLGIAHNSTLCNISSRSMYYVREQRNKMASI